jgi:hypothetical protein
MVAPVNGANEHLLERGRHQRGAPSDRIEICRHRPPPEHPVSFFADYPFDDGAAGGACAALHGQEDEAAAVLARDRQLERQHGSQEPIGHLYEDAGPIAGVGIRPAGAAMFEIDEQLDRAPHDRVRSLAFDVRNETNAAGVVLVAGTIEPFHPLTPDPRIREKIEP